MCLKSDEGKFLNLEHGKSHIFTSAHEYKKFEKPIVARKSEGFLSLEVLEDDKALKDAEAKAAKEKAESDKAAELAAKEKEEADKAAELAAKEKAEADKAEADLKEVKAPKKK